MPICLVYCIYTGYRLVLDFIYIYKLWSIFNFNGDTPSNASLFLVFFFVKIIVALRVCLGISPKGKGLITHNPILRRGKCEKKIRKKIEKILQIFSRYFLISYIYGTKNFELCYLCLSVMNILFDPSFLQGTSFQFFFFAIFLTPHQPV